MREERLEVPVSALREALINALAHRQWEKANLTISIAVYDDRVEIANPGILPPKITAETIKDSHESYPYNRNMAHALYRSTFLESWGSGIHRIIKACREQGVEEPCWRWDGAFVYVTFKRPINHRSSTAQPLINGQHQSSPESIQEQGRSIQESTQESIRENASSHKSIQDSIQEIKNNRDKVLFILSKNPNITLEEVAKIIGLSRIGVQKIAGKLKEEGILSRDGSTKAGKWVVNRKS